VVAKVFTSKSGNTFVNIGAAIFQFRLKQDRVNGEGSGRVLEPDIVGDDDRAALVTNR
jgi:hypothetical protein